MAKNHLTLANQVPCINGMNLPLIAKTYVVMSGDSFASIAQKEKGDSSYAAYIALANDWSENDTPVPGSRLVIPQFIPAKNKANTYAPYSQFVSLIIGGIYPHLEAAPPPPEDCGGGFLGHLISCIAAAIAIVVAPELAPAIGTLLHIGEAAALVIAAGVASALANAAAQGVAIALGVQQHFSLSSVIKSGIQAGLAAGLLDANILQQDMAEQLMSYGKVAIADQLAEMAVGLRSHFDARLVATSMTMQVMDARLDLRISDPLGRNVAHSISDSVVDNLINHTPISVDRIAAQALGTSIGMNLGSPLAQRLHEYNQHIHPVETLRVVSTGQHNTDTESSFEHQGYVSQKENAFRQTRLQRWQQKQSDKPLSGNKRNNLPSHAESTFQEGITDPSTWLSEAGRRTDGLKQHYANQANHFWRESAKDYHAGWKHAIKEGQLYQEGWKLGKGEAFFSEAQLKQLLGNRYHLYSKAVDAVKIAGKAATGYSYMDSVNKIVHAKEGERTRVAMEEVGKQVGSGIGAGVAGGVAAVILAPASPIVEVPGVFAARIAGSAYGWVKGEQGADWLYKEGNEFIQNWRR